MPWTSTNVLSASMATFMSTWAVDVLDVIQIEDRMAIHDPDADGGDLIGEGLGIGAEEAGFSRGIEGVGDGDPVRR